MKICVVSPHFVLDRGGDFSYYLCREFSNMGIDVVVLTSDFNIFDEKTRYGVGWENFENFKIYRIKTNLYMHQATFVKVTKELMKEINPDIVYATEYFQPISISVSKICKDLNIPFFFNQHAYKYPDGTFGIIFRIYDRLIRNSIWNRTKKAMAISVAAKDFLSGLGFDKEIEVISGGVYTDKFKPEQGNLRNRFNINKNTFLVLCVARLIPEKGVLKIPLLAKATEDLNIVYVIVGKGELKEKLEEMISGLKNVYLIDFVPHEKMPGIYSDADLFIAPSDVEVLNYSIMEAMAFGLPILASNVGGMKELVNENVGFLLPKDDIKVWVEKIRELYFKKITFDKKLIIDHSKKYDWKLVSKKVLGVMTSND